MNIERINLLADTIEQHRIKELGFNMMTFASKDHGLGLDRSGHSCGTTACIGGHAVALANANWTLDDLVDADMAGSTHNLHNDARDWLELSEHDADCLFYKAPWGVMFHDVTPAMAVNTLRHLAQTGVVDWNNDANVALVKGGAL